MTRVHPIHRLPQATKEWQQCLNPSRMLGEAVINLTINNSTFSLPIVCQSIQNSHSLGILYGDNPFSNAFSVIVFNLIFINAITHIIGLLLKPLKQPFIISQIIAGIIVGPSFLGRNKWYQHHMKTGPIQFLMNNLGLMGFMFFIFIYAVKMDPSLLKKSGKLHVCTALVNITIPTVIVFSVAIYMRKNMDKDLAKFSSIGVIAGYLGSTSFPVLYQLLKEFNLLNSDAGRIALAMALIGDLVGIISIMLFEASSQGEVKMIYALWFMISLVVVITFLVFCVRPAMIWINNNTDEGHPVQQIFVIAILLGAFVMGFITDSLGISISNGPLFLGLVIPDGPYVGAAIVEKATTIMTDFLLPFSFIMVGSSTDFYTISAFSWSTLSPLFTMVLVGYISKFFCTWITLLWWRLPFRDGLTISLIMSLRGHTELLLFLQLIGKNIIKVPGFTLLILMTTLLTATFSPLISILYDPTKPYMVNQRRNIQHNPPDKELKIVLSIFGTDHDTVNGLMRLLDISNPTPNSPFSISVVKLNELVARANPLFIDHEKHQVPRIYQWHSTINALETHQQVRGMSMKLHFFTVVSPKHTMFRDICELALEEEASLIILPFPSVHVHVHDHAVETVNAQVLNTAPCSVAIFVDKGLLKTNNIRSSFRPSRYRFALLFLGGGDSREALVYADRMLAQPEVSLTVIRFLSHNCIGYNKIEKKLDDGIMTWFWVKNEINQRVSYREVVVKNGEETIEGIQSMNDGAFDLLIVGRKQGINPILLTGLSEWSENEELGLIGDFVSSTDFFGSPSVLVVQQQILRG